MPARHAMSTAADAGHRIVPHTADLRLEAWGPTRERCAAEAVRALVGSFADLEAAQPVGTRERAVVATSDSDLLVAVLDEIIYHLDTARELPSRAEVTATPEGARLRFEAVDIAGAVLIGPVPKAVSLHELRFEPTLDGWCCSVTVDV
ncbi:hypothetical protein GCM10012275_47800 [Longimycelium tulufanense]|uniref:Archease domain-containing protein n=1 Tax=Longimycelium tulufanense TaxID=907463 RepID=A0A8J3CIC4_9PSEU|nr:archease [Longimycelium tulufanense]GGM71746.1 hypothetical protein GCM10012275_47800 [Longimycelium tulufanense]